MDGSQVEARGPFHPAEKKVRDGRGGEKVRAGGRVNFRPSVNFERIYQLHSQRVYYLCLRMVGNPAEAEDLTQEVFLQVYRKLGTFRGDSAFTTWLHRVAVNVVLMKLRRKTAPVVPLDPCRDREDDGTVARPEEGVMDLQMVTLPDRLWLEQALQQLPGKSRVALLLHYVNGYRHQEIARIMGYSIHNSKSQLRRARMRLRKMAGPARRQSRCGSRRAGSVDRN